MVNIKLLQDPHEELGVRPLDPSMFLINVYCVLKNVLEIQAEVRDSMIAAPKTPIRIWKLYQLGIFIQSQLYFRLFKSQKSLRMIRQNSKLQLQNSWRLPTTVPSVETMQGIPLWNYWKYVYLNLNSDLTLTYCVQNFSKLENNPRILTFLGPKCSYCSKKCRCFPWSVC